ncbi:hypothetical protein AA309_13140 [Microvirga vignae]|uniref:Uncharacterized protein n=1 Tax=Microvirga vignae TaxID=1225564 RepID=A0A0H1RBN6_9HYPH|nr:type II and III secretion system protein family protein [Microvirga vignae]KLK92635.1 hypothetical protein AA309_13140 [Microvirga vignae]
MARRIGLRQVITSIAAFGVLVSAPLEFGFMAPAQAQSQDAAPRAKLLRVRLANNKSQALRLDYPFTDVLVGSAEIADVIPLSDQTLYILGKKTGTTNVSILDNSRRVIGVVDVEVGPDIGSVSEKISAGAGTTGIQVRSNGDQLVLEGTAADAVTVDKAVEIAKALAPGGVVNATRVASPQQVMLKVRFIEVNRSAGRELGIRYDYLGRRTDAFIGQGGRDTEGNLLPTLLSGSVPFAHVLSRFANNSRMLDVHIDALEAKGLVRRLAEPNLVAMSGGTATFHAGGKIPIPVASTTQAGIPTITVQMEPFGVRLNFTPTVLSNGLINLDLAPEVSDIDESIAVRSSGISIPGISVRSARTSVELRDGQSFAMAGLLQNTTERNLEQLPWLGSIPVLGALFRSTEFQSRETELVVIVTPHLVKPGKPGDLVATPLDTTLPANDADLFLTGKLEVEKPGDPSAASPTQEWILANREKIKGPYGHILTSPDVVPVAAVRSASTKPNVVRAKN